MRQRSRGNALPGVSLEIAGNQPMLAQTLAWAGINSGTANLPGLETMCGMLAEAFSTLPGHIALVEADPVEVVASDGAMRMVAHGRHLHLTVRPQAPVQVLLTGHMDTVYGADHPFQAVGPTSDERLNGPGVADMKGGLAIMLAALKGVETSPDRDRLGYEVVINSDEETGSRSSAALIARAAIGKLAALTYEPSAEPNGLFAGARPGSGNFSIVVSGRSAHAGRNPTEGRNAIVAAADLALGLYRSQGPNLSINPARIEGGAPNNVVPDQAILRVNMRPRGLDDQARAEAILATLIGQVASNHDVEIRCHGGFGRPPKPIDRAAARLFELVRDCGSRLDQQVRWVPSGGVCDGNNIAACGVPVVDTMGARGGAIHSTDEFLIVESLAERARLSTLVLLELAERGQP